MTIVAAWISALTGVGPSIASGQPRVQRELRRLRHRTAEQAERDQVRESCRAADSPPSDAGEVERPVCLDQQEERERHRRVADRVHDERLLGRGDRARTFVPVADQQVATRVRPCPSRRAGAGGCRPARAAASRRRTATCTRSSAAPRRLRPCSRASRRRSAPPTPETMSIIITLSGSTQDLEAGLVRAARQPRPRPRHEPRAPRRPARAGR